MWMAEQHLAWLDFVLRAGQEIPIPWQEHSPVLYVAETTYILYSTYSGESNKQEFQEIFFPMNIFLWLYIALW